MKKNSNDEEEDDVFFDAVELEDNSEEAAHSEEEAHSSVDDMDSNTRQRHPTPTTPPRDDGDAATPPPPTTDESPLQKNSNPLATGTSVPTVAAEGAESPLEAILARARSSPSFVAPVASDEGEASTGGGAHGSGGSEDGERQHRRVASDTASLPPPPLVDGGLDVRVRVDRRHRRSVRTQKMTPPGAPSPSSSPSPRSSPPSPLRSLVFRVVDKDSGEVHDARDLENKRAAFERGYSLFPSKLELSKKKEEGDDHSEETFDTREQSVTPSSPATVADADAGNVVVDYEHCSLDANGTPPSPSAVTKKKGGMLKFRGFGKKGSAQATAAMATAGDSLPETATTAPRRSAAELRYSKKKKKSSSHALDSLPRNSVPVRLVRKSAKSSEFDPLLLVMSIDKAHDGPIWCTAFSADRRHFASGGEDGVVVIWAVAPGSASMHPGGVAAAAGGRADHFGPGRIDAERSGGVDSNIDDNVELEEEELTTTRCVTGDTQPSSPPLMQGNGPEFGKEVQILSPEPIRRYTDHAADVVDFSWSHTNFLLSASLDKTVRLWHVSRPGCLHIFQHADLVTSVCFSPKEDQFFLSGGFDRKIRVWSIPDGRVKEWAQAPEMVTAARYTPDGRFVVAGLFHGQVYFYSTDGLKYYTQIACRNRSGSQRMGKKVTGLTFLRGATANAGNRQQRQPQKRSGGGGKLSPKLVYSLSLRASPRNYRKASRFKERMLVTTNDSRLRLYGLDDYCILRKYKGLTNSSMQIRATFSESGDYIVCGSEVGNVYIWNTATKTKPLHLNVNGIHNYDRSRSYECFEASRASLNIITDTCFVPSRSMKESLIASNLFPSTSSMDHIDYDMSSAAIVTSDYEGTIRVFLRKNCLDAVFNAFSPAHK